MTDRVTFALREASGEVFALWPPTIRYRLSSFLPPSPLLSDSLSDTLPLFPPSLSLSLPPPPSLHAGGEASCFHRCLRLRASPCGRGGLWPPTIWYRFAYSLSPSISSLPHSLGTSPSCRPSALAFGLRRRPSPCERLHL